MLDSIPVKTPDKTPEMTAVTIADTIPNHIITAGATHLPNDYLIHSQPNVFRRSFSASPVLSFRIILRPL